MQLGLWQSYKNHSLFRLDRKSSRFVLPSLFSYSTMHESWEHFFKLNFAQHEIGNYNGATSQDLVNWFYSSQVFYIDKSTRKIMDN